MTNALTNKMTNAMKRTKGQKVRWVDRPDAWLWGQMIFMVAVFASIVFGLVISAGCSLVDPELDPALEPNASDSGVDWEISTNAAGPGSQYSCVAPMREDYIAAHGGDEASADEAIDAMRHTILFIFDKSGSMSDSWDYRDKWEVAAEAMNISVSMYAHYISAGAIMFPAGEDSCDVNPITAEGQIYFSEGEEFLSQWEASMEIFYPNGSTPLQTAFERADEAIATACADGILDRPFKVVLLTDGVPNCESDDEVINGYAAKWLDHGISTHVIGLPGHSGAADRLLNIAFAGGTAVAEVDTEVDVDVDGDGTVDDIDSDGSIDTEVDTDTGGVVDPDDEDELEDNIAVIIE